VSRVDDRGLRSLRAFDETHRPRSSLVVCNEPAERVFDGIRIVPWRPFFGDLGEGRVIASSAAGWGRAGATPGAAVKGTGEGYVP
jgi:hypothetical protein